MDGLKGNLTHYLLRGSEVAVQNLHLWACAYSRELYKSFFKVSTNALARADLGGAATFDFWELRYDIPFNSIRFDNFNFHQHFKISFVCRCIKMHQVFAIWFIEKIIMRWKFGTGKTSSLQTSFSSSKQASKVYLNDILGRM